jgi:hypothetical protein
MRWLASLLMAKIFKLHQPAYGQFWVINDLLPRGNTMIALGIIIFGFSAVILLAWQFVLKHITRLPGIGYAPECR